MLGFIIFLPFIKADGWHYTPLFNQGLGECFLFVSCFGFSIDYNAFAIPLRKVCLDNDDAGRKACKDITEILGELGKANGNAYKFNVLRTKWGKDYNEMLFAAIESRGVKSWCKLKRR